MRYVVIVEEGETSFGAHVPDLPGCVAVADTPRWGGSSLRWAERQ